jgi:hypothetical protein
VGVLVVDRCEDNVGMMMEVLKKYGNDSSPGAKFIYITRIEAMNRPLLLS